MRCLTSRVSRLHTVLFRHLFTWARETLLRVTGMARTNGDQEISPIFGHKTADSVEFHEVILLQSSLHIANRPQLRPRSDEIKNCDRIKEVSIIRSSKVLARERLWIGIHYRWPPTGIKGYEACRSCRWQGNNSLADDSCPCNGFDEHNAIQTYIKSNAPVFLCQSSQKPLYSTQSEDLSLNESCHFNNPINLQHN